MLQPNVPSAVSTGLLTSSRVQGLPSYGMAGAAATVAVTVRVCVGGGGAIAAVVDTTGGGGAGAGLD